MVDIQRRAVLRSLAKGAASGARSPHVYQTKMEVTAALPDVDASDAAFFRALGSSSPAAAAATTNYANINSASSSHAFGHHQHALSSLSVPGADDDDGLFAAYAAEPQQQELDEALRATPWDLYYGAPPTTSVGPVTPSSSSALSHVAPSSLTVTVSSSVGRGAARTAPRQGVKRPLDRSRTAASSTAMPMPLPTPSVATSMLAMRTNAADAVKASVSATPTTTTPTSQAPTSQAPTATPAARGRATGPGRRTKKDDTAAANAANGNASCSSGSDEPPTKKTKVSRERQLKINAASRRCRKKQKLELQFLRTHVVDLQSALKDQVGLLRSTGSHQARIARLATFLEESIRHVEDMSSGGRPGTPKASLFNEADLQQLKATADQARAEANANSNANAQPKPSVGTTVPTPTTTTPTTPASPAGSDGAGSARATDALSDDRRRSLLNIASFMRNNLSLESQSFSPEVISCLPIEMDGWQLRLAITEKNYTIHNCKFFPYKVEDMYDFCWETNVASKVSVLQGKNDYCVVTPLDADVAHVYSKTIGKWSLSVHGVANVSYNSLVCRTSSFHDETRRAMICQQSVLEDRDFQDESTIPWLFKRWVVFQSRVVDGVEGTFVEAYRTASYATGRLIYKEDNTYDSFCEHLIRRYAESNALLERMMARDPRFQLAHSEAFDDLLLEDHEETTSDRMVKDLLLF